ncbi:MAG: thioredoxin family protein [Gammaproteobacteria bacterium]|nr:MAG: thioredoxin family protein [Gammaproteobacteria bacterium]
MISKNIENRVVIELMTTSGCHLCDEASQMFHYLLNEKPLFAQRFELQLVEIANDDKLIENFGMRIPVLKSNENELGWIFTMDELYLWLESL